MAIQDLVNKAIDEWGKQLLLDLKQSLVNKDIEGTGGQESNLASRMRTHIVEDSNGIRFYIEAPGYWRYVDQGRKSGKQPPAKAMQDYVKSITGKNGFDPRKVVEEMKLKKGGGKLRKPKKKMNFDKAVKSVAFIMGRAIGRKGTIKRFGYKGADFVAPVMTDERILSLQKSIALIIGKEISIEFQGVKVGGLKTV